MKHDNRYASAGILTYALELCEISGHFKMISWPATNSGPIMNASGASKRGTCHYVDVWNSTGIADPTDRTLYSERHRVGRIDMRPHAALHEPLSAVAMLESFGHAVDGLIAEYESGGA